VISRWMGELDDKRLSQVLDGGSEDEFVPEAATPERA
jgi:hypothetical protein